MKLTHFAQMRALESAYVSTNQGFVDHLLRQDEAQGGKLRQDMQLKRIQFDATAGLAEELDSVCGLLDVSKRQFLEGAVWEALDQAKTAYFAKLDELARDDSGAQLTLEAA